MPLSTSFWREDEEESSCLLKNYTICASATKVHNLREEAPT